MISGSESRHPVSDVGVRGLGCRPGLLVRDMYTYTVDSKQLEYGYGMICHGVPSFLGFGAGGWSYSNFLASTVHVCNHPEVDI